MVAQTRRGDHTSPKKLMFREKLITKGQTTDVLLKKIQKLHKELAALDQDHVDSSSLDGVRKELISHSIMLHKDKGVKAFAACCMADVLKLYAPDAPYTQGELRDIFQFFFRQLVNGLTRPECSYFEQYFYILDSLSTVKSVVLICDLPNAEELMREAFRDCFALVRRDLSKKVEIFLADILVAVIEECQSFPVDTLELILAQFMARNTGPEQASYRLATQVCNQTAPKLQRTVSMYFSDILINTSQEEDIAELQKSHELIKRLHQSCPALLLSVIPQLENELGFDEVQIRTLVTEVVGEMLADKAGVELVKNHPTLWSTWLHRKNDKATPVRLKFVESAKDVLVSQAELRKEIEDSYRTKLLDPDEKIRAAVCKCLSSIDYETALHIDAEETGDGKEKLLRLVLQRAKDRKAIVRSAALHCLGRLYNLAYNEIDSNDPTAIEKFAWIPDQILTLYSTHAECRMDVEEVMAEHIIPLPTSVATIDEGAWTDHLIGVMKYLHEGAASSLLSMTGLQYMHPTIYEHFLNSCVDHNGGVIDDDAEKIKARLNGYIQYLASFFPDQTKAAEDMHTFADLNEKRLYKLFKTCTDPQTDLKGLTKATSDFLKKMEQVSEKILPTMSVILRRASLWVVNQSSIPTLMTRLSKEHGTALSHANLAAKHAKSLLQFVSRHSPSLYKSHVAQLLNTVAEGESRNLVTVALQALAATIKWDPHSVPSDPGFVEKIRTLALGSDATQTKFATRYLAFSRNKGELCSQLAEEVADSLETMEPELLSARVALLGQLSRFASGAFDEHGDVFMEHLLKKVIMVPSGSSEPEDDEVLEEWVEDDEMDDALSARICALKVCRYRCLSHAKDPAAVEIATPTLKMMVALLDHGGKFTEHAPEDIKVMARMRLQAAVSLLYISSVDTYAVVLHPKFLRLAMVTQDSCYNVRHLFLTKLINLLQARKLPARFNLLPFLTVHDPESDVRTLASSYVVSAYRRAKDPNVRLQHFELIFIRLLHLLAHHPDFNVAHEDLLDTAKYLQFYFDLIVNQDNISLIFHLAQKGKTVRDADGPVQSQNFYVVCELAQELLKLRAHNAPMTILSYPGKIKLPPDILRPMPTPEASRENIQQVYLPKETTEWIHSQYKGEKTKEKKERKQPSVAKRKAPTATNGHAKRPRRRRRQSDDMDDGDESVLEDSDEDAEERKRSPTPSGDVDMDDEPLEEELGRGARGKAKARLKRRQRAKIKEARDEDDET